jgi:hypothetical protein
MELENRTPFPASIFRGGIDKERLFASPVAKITYRLEGSRLRIADEQFWKVAPGPLESPYGVMPSDELFYRGGVDVFVFGKACAPRGKPIERMEVTVEVGGSFRHTIAVIGDRVWESNGGSDPAPSKPESFVEMPLDLAHAYGGIDVWDELEVPFPDNPQGRGFAIDKKSVIGKPLPNVESPAQPIQQWNDQPEPVGVGAPPPFFGPRLNRCVEFDERTGTLKKLHPTFFNAAFPAMVAPRIRAGDQIRVTGVCAGGPLELEVPDSGLNLHLAFGDQRHEVDLPVDQIGIEAEKQRVFITYRYPFRYRLIPLQKRSCTLVWKRRGT